MSVATRSRPPSGVARDGRPPSAPRRAASKYVYDFSRGSASKRDLLGGKGANIAEMTRIGGSVRVPPGFTITTEACIAYMREGHFPSGLEQEVRRALSRLERKAGKRLGDADDPLLVSVRSGARLSMPGMMDTVLNLGLNEESVEGLAKRTDNERFAWDSYRRFTQMFGNVVRGIDGSLYEDAIKRVKRRKGVELDTDLDAADLRRLTAAFKRIFQRRTGEEFPTEPREQLRQAIRAVFDSWNGERAIEYRRQNHIPHDWGTAVNVQQMVFGNKGRTSGSGVAFSRDEITGAARPSGDFLPDAQGEDVVSGVRNTLGLPDLKRMMPRVHAQLMDILKTLDRRYRDMQDVEFTVEEGVLYMLQTRSAKRPAQAAVRVAVEMVNEGLLTKAQALQRIDAAKLEALLRDAFDSAYEYEPLATGVAASPGAAKGKIAFSALEAVKRAKAGEQVILVREFTEADDVAGFQAAQGVLTARGGKASHAALVARGMGKPCVSGASALEIDAEERVVRVNGRRLGEKDEIAIDGTTGKITTDDVPLVEPRIGKHFRTVLEWADEFRRLGVRANADSPEEARRARELGAEGIGLCRTEHMFMAADRQPKMRRMILADDEANRRKALDEMLPLQQRDFEGLFRAMKGLPVTIRLLDPPLHEFLPRKEELVVQIDRLTRRRRGGSRLKRLERELQRLRELEETNPMLGTRGCRLGIVFPEVYEMQVRAIIRAALAVRRRTRAEPQVEIMIPLVDYERELEDMRSLVNATAGRTVLEANDKPIRYRVGTMIELPRACLVADRIAAFADFFSFGTNDLTQTALGFSRDDVEGKFLAHYLDEKIVDRSPFETIDVPGVGALVRMGAEKGRGAKSDLKLGVCGEHGGDPDSIAFFHELGLDYVSCSPYRVPTARVAAAQAAISEFS
jgi:pyruvate, orthophosphate dikinase